MPIALQDNATCHTSGVVVRFLKASKIRTVVWPPKSPDLNLIENLWGIMKHRVQCRRPSTPVELEAFCKQEWRAITRNAAFMQKLYGSMRTRVQLVIDNAGGPCGY